MPRLLAAVLVGAALSASGAASQAVFRNPMADPGLLGVSAGAACGAAAGILWTDSVYTIQAMSFAGGVLAVLCAAGLARSVHRGGDSTLTLILCGIVVNALCTALLSLAKYGADPYNKLPAITYWLMGGLTGVNGADTLRAAWLVPPALLVLWMLRGPLDALSFGEEEARSLGVRPMPVRLAAIAAGTLLVAGAVSLCGLVGWVGILVPHVARLLVGPRFSLQLPASILLGGLYLLGVDTLARSAFPLEVPLGIVTALFGAPTFAMLLARGRRA
jgi:iron complex transport system permease protein